MEQVAGLSIPIDEIMEIEQKQTHLQREDTVETNDPTAIQSTEETEDILSEAQILALLEESSLSSQLCGSDELDDSDQTFKPEDFGLTEEDIKAHEEMRKKRKAYITRQAR